MGIGNYVKKGLNLVGIKVIRTQPFTLTAHRLSKPMKHQRTILYQFEEQYWMDYGDNSVFHNGVDLWG